MRFRGLDAVRTVESRGHIDRGKEKKNIAVGKVEIGEGKL